jgi:ADP-ribose pyrophosphatase YjhB (NUDIX family)
VGGIDSTPSNEVRVVKFAFTAADGHIFSWIRADSCNESSGPHVDLPGGKADSDESLIQAAHRQLQNELCPYGPDLQALVDLALRKYPKGHSLALVRFPTGDTNLHSVMVWGIGIPSTEQLTAIKNSKHLKARWRPPSEVWPSFRGRRAPYGTAVRQAWGVIRSGGSLTAPPGPEKSADDGEPLAGDEESVEVPPWMALSLPHRPDATLLHKSQRERALPESTACALAIAATASQQPLAARVEELKSRLSQPDPSWLDYNHWLLAMGKLYQDPGRGTVTRSSVRPKVSLHWRTERLLEPCKGRPPRVATELQTLMEEEKLRRSAAIRAPDTEPHTRKQLIEQEELLAQAYHYLATRPK